MLRLNLRQVVILLSSGVAIFYILYRALFTLNLVSPYAVFASLFLYIGEVYGVITMLLFFLQVWDTSEPPEQPVLKDRTVDVFVPTYNEDPDLLRTTLRACVAMDYPHKTYLCDDGGTEARLKDPVKGPPSAERAAILKALCAEVGAIYVTRPANNHAKAGNLNFAFTKTDGEFIIIFDADHVPDPNFITRLLGYFADEKLGFVQTPHAFYNFESFQARLNHDRRQYWEEGQLFYHVIQTGRNFWNAPIFAGSAAMFRRKALEEVGYIATETITEDMHTGLRMHTRGWKSLGCSTRMISGAAAQDVTTFHSQRLRWGEGNLSVLAHDNPLTIRGLTWGQRLCYLGTMINWCGGLFKLPIYLTPLLMLFTGVPPVKEFTPVLALMMAIYMMVCIFGTKFVSNGYGSIWYSELFTMASFWTQIQGTMRAAFLRKLQQFVVTAKRGRQSKSIWPYIRPQVYIIAVSVVALLWAWGRIWLAISDDYYKPMLASFWTLFHALLAYLIVRRALWPDERRYSTRHLVHLPIAYSVLGEDQDLIRENFGVSIDLNERGLGFVAYERLPEGARLRLTMHAPGETVTVEGMIKSFRSVIDNGAEPTGPMTGIRYGVEFANLDSAQTDSLQHICLHYAVPRLYSDYAVGHQTMPQSAWGRFARFFLRRRFTERREYHLPLFFHPDDPAAVVPTVTEDLSRTAASVFLADPPQPGTKLPFQMASPLGMIRGTANVLRALPRVFAARRYHLCVLEFAHLDGQGWNLLQSLFRPRVSSQLQPVLKLSREGMPVPMNRPLIAALLILVPLVAGEFGVFRWTYRDDFFLKNLSIAASPLTPAESERLDRIYRDSVRGGFASTDRLVLLSTALRQTGRMNELAAVTKLLAPRDRNNLNLQMALAYVCDQQQDYDQAEAEFSRLIEALDKGQFPAGQREELLLAAARSAAHAGDLDRASTLFRRIMETWPDNLAYRNEFAGVLLSGQRVKEAAALYQGIEPDYDGRILLVLINTQARRYEVAAQQARALLVIRPGDPTVEGLLADVLNLQGHHLQAGAIYRRLLSANVADLRISVQLAHGLLANKNYQEALERFQEILDKHLDNPELLTKHPEVLKAYINAAASAPEVGKGQLKTVQVLYNQTLTTTERDPFFLARLGWVLHRLGEDEKCVTILEQALALEPTDPALRRQLASLFVAAGQPDMALKVLGDNETDTGARLLLVDSYTQARNFTAAASTCRAILEKHPDHTETRVRLANILSWDKSYKQALELFGALAKEDPTNTSYPMRIAEVTLWSGEAQKAAALFEALLLADFDRPALWWGFVDAASACPRLTDAQARIILAINDKTLEGEHRSPRVLAAFRKEGRQLTEDSYLTRLAWALHEHIRDDKRANGILDKAMALQPGDPARRKELAGVLAGVKRYREALSLYEGLKLELADRPNLARLYAAVGDFKAAAEQCRLVLRTQPLDRESQVLLADVLSWGREFSQSLDLFGKLRQAFPKDVYLARRQAEVTLWSGEPARALQMFGTLLEVDVNQPLLWPGYLESAGRVETLTIEQASLARQIAARPIEDLPRNVELLARLAWVLHRHLDNKVEAATLLQRAVKLNSQEPVVLSRLAWILYTTGDKTRVDQVLRQAVALRPQDPSQRQELAGVLAATQHFKEALELYEDLARLAPNDAAVQANFAEVTLWSGAATLALERLQRLLEVDFQQPRLWRCFVDAASGIKELDAKQVRLLQRIAEAPPPEETTNKRAVYWSRLAWVLYREGNRSAQPALKREAVGLLDRAVALGPSDPRTRQELAGVLAAAGRFKEGAALLEASARAQPGDRDLQLTLAKMTLWAGDHVKAMGLLQHLLEFNREQPELTICFVDAAAGAPKGTMTAAQIDLISQLAARPVPETAPEKVQYLSRLAWIMYREGKPDQANGLLDKAVALKPRDPKARRDLAGVMTAAGRHKEALEWLEELIRNNPGDEGLNGQLAQATLWSGQVNLALDRLQKLLTAHFEQPGLWVSYLDATSRLNQGTLTREQLQLIVRIADRPVPETVPDKVLYLSRLAWVLYREQHKEKAGALLDAAVALRPTDPRVRRELAGVLVAVGKNEAGLRLYEGLTLNLEDHFQLVVLLAASRQFPEAEKHCRAILKERPADARARQWLADLLLWSNQYELALSMYQEMLTAKFEQPRLWPTYLEAASFTPTLTPEQVRMAVRICDSSASQTQDPLVLIRMALVLDMHVERPATLPGLLAGVVGLLGTGPALPSLTTTSRMFAEQARTTRARTLLSQALSLRPREATVLARLAWMTHRMGLANQAATLLDEAIALQPAEPAVRREVGDVLVAIGRLKDGLHWFEDLATSFPKNRDFQIRLAEVTVWAGDYLRGLERLEKVLGPDLEPRSLWHTFVDAASSAGSMTPSQVAVALRFVEQPVPEQGVSQQTLYLSRLAWSLFREGERNKTETWLVPVERLLDKAIRLQPQDPEVRRELGGVLTATRRFKDALVLYTKLAGEFPNDVDLQVRLAEVATWSGDLVGGLEKFEGLWRDNVRLPRVWTGFVNAAASAPTLTRSQAELAFQLAGQPSMVEGGVQEVAYLSRLAWVLLREMKPAAREEWRDRAGVMLDRAVGLKPADEDVRRELAGVLGAAGKHQQGLQMYDGLKLNLEDRFRLSQLHAGASQFAEAEKEAKAILEQRPDDKRALKWLAQLALWRGDYAAALEQLAARLREDFQQPDLWRSYADAAAGSRQLTEGQIELALRIADQPGNKQTESLLFLVSLSRALHREGQRKEDATLLARAAALAEQALALRPKKSQERRELAGLLAAVGKTGPALTLLEGTDQDDVSGRLLVLSILAAEKRLDEAETEARGLAKRNPGDLEVQFQLASVLAWNKKLDEAGAIFEQLQKVNAMDARLPRKLAEVALWAGHYDKAVERYQALLARDWQQPDLWAGYVDAAAGAKKLPEVPHKKLVLRLYEAVVAKTPRDAVFLSRFGWVLRRLEEPKKGVTLLKQAIALNPKDRETRRLLAEALQDMGNYDEAEQHFQLLLRTPVRRP